MLILTVFQGDITGVYPFFASSWPLHYLKQQKAILQQRTLSVQALHRPALDGYLIWTAICTH